MMSQRGFFTSLVFYTIQVYTVSCTIKSLAFASIILIAVTAIYLKYTEGFKTISFHFYISLYISKSLLSFICKANTFCLNLSLFKFWERDMNIDSQISFQTDGDIRASQKLKQEMETRG